MKIEKAQGLLEANAHCYRKELRGKMKNEDIVV
jgi:hypothetical protein